MHSDESCRKVHEKSLPKQRLTWTGSVTDSLGRLGTVKKVVTSSMLAICDMKCNSLFLFHGYEFPRRFSRDAKSDSVNMHQAAVFAKTPGWSIKLKQSSASAVPGNVTVVYPSKRLRPGPQLVTVRNKRVASRLLGETPEPRPIGFQYPPSPAFQI